ncbi:hypothetical protein EPI10_030376 [Gossypium australe]|uniref:Uncharacterized protein n=1 Tax=Gossypium australe TaxID=47621 RepID=A0A5B6X0S9_9ROSI|nr:hypothetical protein EPI10_030376 [Gossypium australe]
MCLNISKPFQQGSVVIAAVAGHREIKKCLGEDPGGDCGALMAVTRGRRRDRRPDVDCGATIGLGARLRREGF